MNVIQTSARDINLTAPPGDQHAGDLAAGAARRPFPLSRFLRTDPVGLRADQPRRHQADRGRARAGIRGVGRERADRRRQHHHEVAAGGAGHDRRCSAPAPMDRDVGSTAGEAPARLFDADVSTSQVVNDHWSYRLSAGYFNSDAYPRPTGQIPVIPDPRDPTGRRRSAARTIRSTRPGAFGTAFQNRGTQPAEIRRARRPGASTSARSPMPAGVAGTSGTIYTGIGPFDIQPGSVLAYGKVNYSRGRAASSISFTNIVDGEAPNLLLPDPLDQPAAPAQFQDADLRRRVRPCAGAGTAAACELRRQLPAEQLRHYAGARGERSQRDGRLRAGRDLPRTASGSGSAARVDKFGNIADPGVLAAVDARCFRRARRRRCASSFNRAFRSPSVVNNYLDVALVNPVDLRALAPLLPPPLQPAGRRAVPAAWCTPSAASSRSARRRRRR